MIRRETCVSAVQAGPAACKSIAAKNPCTQSDGYVVVAGGVNIDIGGRAYASIAAKDSNPGRVTVSLGGVGRNIAHNLRLLDVNVCLLTALGQDLYAERILESCAELQINLSHALRVPDASTSIYLFLSDPGGDMAAAVSDMEICERLQPEYFAANLPLINGAQLVVADTNIPAESLQYLLNHCTAPAFVDPVSVSKAMKLRPLLHKIHTLKPNRLEAEYLSGIQITDHDSLCRAARRLLELGVQRVFISLGADGVLAATQEEMLLLPCFPAMVQNATGAGDAFMAALAWAYLQGEDLKSSALAAAAAAAMAVESTDTINSAISADAVRRRVRSTGGNKHAEQVFGREG